MNKSVEEFYMLTIAEKSRKRWRLLAIIAIALMIFIVWKHADAPMISGNKSTPHIARVQITGMILDSDFQTQIFNDLAADNSVKALLVEVDSPGGTMVGGISLYQGLQKVSQAKKPVVVVMKTVAASAGYLLALGADYIFTNEATLTGSIGVFMPMIDASELAQKIGIKSEDVASGSLKTATNPIKPKTTADKAYLQEMVDTLNQTFYKYLQQNRPKLSKPVIAKMKDGRALVGIQALQMGLVDAIGNTEDGRNWLIAKAGLAKNISVLNYELAEKHGWLTEAIEGSLPTWLVGLGMQNQLAQKPAIMALMR